MKTNWRLDWWLLGAALTLAVFGLLSMAVFRGDNYFFNHQLVWLIISLGVFLLASFIDWHFLRRPSVIITFFVFFMILTALVPVLGTTARGAVNRFNLGPISFQPSDFMKLVLILVLAKYFSRRHIEIAAFRHVLISGFYAFLPFLLILRQPDLGSALIIFFIWLGMIIVSGVSKRHLLVVLVGGALVASGSWFYLAPYQQARILTFLNPRADIRGAGYNAFQSMIAVGSGEWLGKGVGYGTQSRLQFLPEYQTDFIFAAFAEEWGLIGVLIVFSLFGLLFWRLIKNAMLGATNFESLFGLGLVIFYFSHFVIHVGMNMRLLPVTGLPLPFMSYGGSHLVVEFLGLGIFLGMSRYARAFHRADIHNEFVGPQ